MSIIKKTDNAQHRLKCESTITLVEKSICSTTLESHLVSLTKSEPQAIPLLGTQPKCLHVCTPRHLQKCSCSIICNSPYWNNPVSINYRLHILIVIWSEKGTLHTNESIKTTALWNNTVEFHKHSVEERKTNTKAGILSTLLIESEKKQLKYMVLEVRTVSTFEEKGEGNVWRGAGGVFWSVASVLFLGLCNS